MKFTLDLHTLYYLIEFHKTDRYKEAREILQPLSLAFYAKEYITAIQKFDGIVAKQEDKIHNKCLEMANRLRIHG